MSLSLHERETVLTVSDGDDLVHVWTAQPTVIRRLTKDERWTCVESGIEFGSPYAIFTIPADQWNPLSGTKRKRKPLTQEQQENLRQRLAKARDSRTLGEAS